MSAIAIVDTSIVLNVLDIPHRNQNRDDILARFETEIRDGTNLLLPMAAIVETGNFIAQIDGGRVRRERAEQFVTQVRAALDGAAPWKPLAFPDKAILWTWLNGFPDMAMRGIGMGDLSMIELWKTQCALFPLRRVFIWSVDSDLNSYDRQA